MWFSDKISGLCQEIDRDPLLSHKDEFPGGGLKRWRDVPVFLRIWDIARWAGSYISNLQL